MSPAQSSPPPDPGEAVVDLFVIGRTLRGTLGAAFLADCIEAHERMHGAGAAPHTALSRTVELTAAAVTRCGAVRVRCLIADPAFLSPAPLEPAASAPDATSSRFSVDADALDGMPPVAVGPGAADRRRTVEVQVAVPDGGEPLLVVHVVAPPMSPGRA